MQANTNPSLNAVIQNENSLDVMLLPRIKSAVVPIGREKNLFQNPVLFHVAKQMSLKGKLPIFSNAWNSQKRICSKDVNVKTMVQFC